MGLAVKAPAVTTVYAVAAILGVLVPLIVYAMEADRRRHERLDGRLDHLDDCIDNVRQAISGTEEDVAYIAGHQHIDLRGR